MTKDVAVVGTGSWGRNLVRTFVGLLGEDRVVACDSKPEGISQVKMLHAGVRTTQKLSSVLSDGRVGSVAIATPAVTHFEIARQVLAAGKPAFVEKPLAMTASDAEELVALAERRGVSLMVDHLLLFHPAVEALMRVVRDHQLGEVFYVYGQRTNLGIVRTEENALWSLGPHDIAMVLEVLGPDPLVVTAQGGTYLQVDKKIEDVVFVTIRFPAGQVAHLHLSWLDPHKVRRMTVVGSNKMVVFDDIEPLEKLRIYDKGVTVWPDAIGPQVRYGDIVIPEVGMAEPLRVACEHFLTSIRDGTTPRTDGHAGLRVVQVLQAAQESLGIGGQPIELPTGTGTQ